MKRFVISLSFKLKITKKNILYIILRKSNNLNFFRNGTKQILRESPNIGRGWDLIVYEDHRNRVCQVSFDDLYQRSSPQQSFFLLTSWLYIPYIVKYPAIIISE